MWSKGTRAKLPFSLPLIWCEHKDYSSDRVYKLTVSYTPSVAFSRNPCPSLEEGDYRYGADESNSNDEDFELNMSLYVRDSNSKS